MQCLREKLFFLSKGARGNRDIRIWELDKRGNPIERLTDIEYVKSKINFGVLFDDKETEESYKNHLQRIGQPLEQHYKKCHRKIVKIEFKIYVVSRV